MENKEIIRCNETDCEWNEDSECMNENEYLACLIMEYYFNKNNEDIEQ